MNRTLSNLASSLASNLEDSVNQLFELKAQLEELASKKEEVARKLEAVEHHAIELVEQGCNATPSFYLKVRESTHRLPTWRGNQQQEMNLRDMKKGHARHYKSLIISITGYGIQTGPNNGPTFDDAA